MRGHLVPGVRVEEAARGPASNAPTAIEGVETATAAFLGETERGPLTPSLVTSYRHFAQLFGGPFAEDRYLPHAVRAFFKNGGRRLFVARVRGRGSAPPDAIDFAGGYDEAGEVIGARHELRGLAALAQPDYREVSLIHAPGIGNDQEGAPIQAALVRHCEAEGQRFAVLDAAANRSAPGPRAPDGPRLERPLDPPLDPRRCFNKGRGSRHAAIYHPWLWASFAEREGERLLPPGGFVCGAYARNDEMRGVWKAPSNLTLEGALALERPPDRRLEEQLSARGVNCMRQLPGRGPRVWGARTLSHEQPWNYVPLQRYRLFLEASITAGTKWVAFEPNGPRLWAKVRQTVTDFLRRQWRAGALFGGKEEEAFRAAVGRKTMTLADIAAGRLIIEIAIAPLRPAEFIVIRIAQNTRDAG